MHDIEIKIKLNRKHGQLTGLNKTFNGCEMVITAKWRGTGKGKVIRDNSISMKKVRFEKFYLFSMMNF